MGFTGFHGMCPHCHHALTSHTTGGICQSFGCYCGTSIGASTVMSALTPPIGFFEHFVVPDSGSEARVKQIEEFTRQLLSTLPKPEQAFVYKALYAAGHRLTACDPEIRRLRHG